MPIQERQDTDIRVENMIPKSTYGTLELGISRMSSVDLFQEIRSGMSMA